MNLNLRLNQGTSRADLDMNYAKYAMSHIKRQVPVRPYDWSWYFFTVFLGS